MVTDFQVVFSLSQLQLQRLSSKFATNSCLHVPPRLDHVATLPCEKYECRKTSDNLKNAL